MHTGYLQALPPLRVSVSVCLPVCMCVCIVGCEERWSTERGNDGMAYRDDISVFVVYFTPEGGRQGTYDSSQ